MILSGLGELKHPQYWWWAVNRPAKAQATPESAPESTDRPRNLEWSEGTSDSHHIHSYACKQGRYSKSVIKCSTIQWDENRKQQPSTLDSSSVIHVSSSLTNPTECSLNMPSMCAGLFIYPSLLREGRGLLVRGLGAVWRVQKKKGAGGILAALDAKSPALAPSLPSLNISCPVPAFLTQLPAVMDDDMCHITATCINSGSVSSMLACFWMDRRSGPRGDMWHLRHSNWSPFLPWAGLGWGDLKLPGWIGETSSEGPGSMFTNGSKFLTMTSP